MINRLKKNDGLGIFLKISVAISVMLIAWYGSKPLANEYKIAINESNIEKVDEQSKRNAKEIVGVENKLQVLSKCQSELNANMREQKVMIEYLYNQAMKERRLE